LVAGLLLVVAVTRYLRLPRSGLRVWFTPAVLPGCAPVAAYCCGLRVDPLHRTTGSGSSCVLVWILPAVCLRLPTDYRTPHSSAVARLYIVTRVYHTLRVLRLRTLPDSLRYVTARVRCYHVVRYIVLGTLFVGTFTVYVTFVVVTLRFGLRYVRYAFTFALRTLRLRYVYVVYVVHAFTLRYVCCYVVTFHTLPLRYVCLHVVYTFTYRYVVTLLFTDSLQLPRSLRLPVARCHVCVYTYYVTLILRTLRCRYLRLPHRDYVALRVDFTCRLRLHVIVHVYVPVSFTFIHYVYVLLLIYR